jgi:molybdopterin molybdotransferase
MTGSEAVEINDARRSVLAHVAPLETVAVELDSALGRVLARDLTAPLSLPPFDSSAMDGFAVKAEDVARASRERPACLKLVGEARAGCPATIAVGSGQTVAISTGAVLPAGADAIVRVELTRARNGIVEALGAVSAGADIRRAGEDIVAGARVLARGTTLGAAALGVLASLGHSDVACAARPRVSVIVTGDELLAPDEELRAGTLRDSNSHTVAALARSAGAQVVRRVRVGDDFDATQDAIAIAARDSDAVVICGGVSVGAHDHVRPSLAALGAEQEFWGLALKPGHPTWFGTLDRVPVFGLPGNPVSAIVTFILLVDPALRAMQGAPADALAAEAILDEDYCKPAGRAHAVRCRLRRADDGWHAQPTGAQGSHILSSMLAADALAIIPSEATTVPAGARVRVELLRPWLTGAAP